MLKLLIDLLDYLLIPCLNDLYSKNCICCNTLAFPYKTDCTLFKLLPQESLKVYNVLRYP